MNIFNGKEKLTEFLTAAYRLIACTILAAFMMVANASGQAAYFLVKGRVTDKTTGSPLQSASVFAQNTTFGVLTDADGNFSMRLPGGGYSLVVTYTGFETESARVTSSDPQNENLSFEMSPQTQSLEEVSVALSNEVKDGWQKYGEFFINNFIGQSGNAKQTTIKNTDVLHFYFSKKRNRLKVLAKEPVTVENNALGYILHFAIDSFTYEYNSTTNLFIGYPLFEEMTGTPEQMEVWRTNRLKAFQGSMLQFMRSMYNKNLEQTGYELQLLVSNGAKDVPVPLEDIYTALNFSKDDSSGVAEIRPMLPNLAVVYKNMRPEPAYLKIDSLAAKNYQLSKLVFAPGETINIEQNGYFFDQTDVTSNGYLGFRKIGDMLPYDYSPMAKPQEPTGGQ